MPQPQQQPPSPPDTRALGQEALTVLRRMSEPGAVLAVADRMEKAVVVRGDGSGAGTRTAVVDVAVAEAMALNDWISCDAPGRICRYRITGTGRAALRQMLAEAENRARTRGEVGFAETQVPYFARGDDPEDDDGPARRGRYCRAESPLTLLARRKDRDGQPFLDATLVRAGERLREDFELAQVGPRVTQNWDRFLTAGGQGGPGSDAEAAQGPGAARARVCRALSDLGPGLSDVALRCCCYLEGLEQAERRLGWSARSGKIVLRIALQRLKVHYGEMTGDALIG